MKLRDDDKFLTGMGIGILHMSFQYPLALCDHHAAELSCHLEELQVILSNAKGETPPINAYRATGTDN